MAYVCLPAANLYFCLYEFFSLVPLWPDFFYCDDKHDFAGDNFAVAVAKEDVIPQLNAALLAAHARVAAARALCCTLLRSHSSPGTRPNNTSPFFPLNRSDGPFTVMSPALSTPLSSPSSSSPSSLSPSLLSPSSSSLSSSFSSSTLPSLSHHYHHRSQFRRRLRCLPRSRRCPSHWACWGERPWGCGAWVWGVDNEDVVVR